MKANEIVVGKWYKTDDTIIDECRVGKCLGQLNGDEKVIFYFPKWERGEFYNIQGCHEDMRYHCWPLMPERLERETLPPEGFE